MLTLKQVCARSEKVCHLKHSFFNSYNIINQATLEGALKARTRWLYMKSQEFNSLVRNGNIISLQPEKGEPEILSDIKKSQFGKKCREKCKIVFIRW